MFCTTSKFNSMLLKFPLKSVIFFMFQYPYILKIIIPINLCKAFCIAIWKLKKKKLYMKLIHIFIKLVVTLVLI